MRCFCVHFVCLLSVVCCLQPASAQLNSFFVDPQTVDPLYAATDDSSYIAINPSITTNNKLLVFFPGTGAKTKHYRLFIHQAANLGYHCISLSYPNEDAAAGTCAGSSDEDCFVNYRQEICYGSDASDEVNVDELHCIRTRLVKLLQYLHTTYPSQGWEQFLSGTNPVWSSIAVSGHSQGSGHALYIGKTQAVERVLMFAGANDYSLFFNEAANWISSLGLTPAGRYFSLLHKNDDVFSYAYQFEVMESAGMLAADDSTRVDNINPPYGNSHCLYTTTAPANSSIPGAEHNGMVVDFYVPTNAGQPVYAPTWVYMLSASLTELEEKNETQLTLFPNPVAGQFTVNWQANVQNVHCSIIDPTGKTVRELEPVSGNSAVVDASELNPGLYFLFIAEWRTTFIVR